MLLALPEQGVAMADMNVIKAENGLFGWKLINSNAIDVVLTDNCRPGVDGVELS